MRFAGARFINYSFSIINYFRGFSSYYPDNFAFFLIFQGGRKKVIPIQDQKLKPTNFKNHNLSMISLRSL